MTEPTSWQAIRGGFEFAPAAIVFHGGIQLQPSYTSSDSSSSSSSSEDDDSYDDSGGDDTGSVAAVASGLAMSNVRFTGGTVDVAAEWVDARAFPSVQVIVQRNTRDASMITAGVGGSAVGRKLSSRFVIRAFDGSEETGGWETLARTSAVPRPASGRMALRVVQTGSLLDLYADDVNVLRHVLPTTRAASQCGLYCRASDDVKVSTYSVGTHQRSAFVVMQFGTPYDQLYTDVIRPVVAGCGFEVVRADDEFGPGLIIADVVRRIQEAEVIIADITPENQNVFYEVGYAHALGKPTILLAEKGKRLPFDVSGFRTLFYENSIAGKAAVEQGLRRHVEAITRERPLALAV